MQKMLRDTDGIIPAQNPTNYYFWKFITVPQKQNGVVIREKCIFSREIEWFCDSKKSEFVLGNQTFFFCEIQKSQYVSRRMTKMLPDTDGVIQK